MILFRYFDFIHDGDNQIFEYELKLLEKKIRHVEKIIARDLPREEILLTKQNVLVELMNKCSLSFGKKRKNIENDIRQVEKLDLNIRDTVGYKEIVFQINNRKVVMFVDEKNNMINKQYEIMYEILRKYNMICEIHR